MRAEKLHLLASLFVLVLLVESSEMPGGRRTKGASARKTQTPPARARAYSIPTLTLMRQMLEASDIDAALAITEEVGLRASLAALKRAHRESWVEVFVLHGHKEQHGRAMMAKALPVAASCGFSKPGLRGMLRAIGDPMEALRAVELGMAPHGEEYGRVVRCIRELVSDPHRQFTKAVSGRRLGDALRIARHLFDHPRAAYDIIEGLLAGGRADLIVPFGRKLCDGDKPGWAQAMLQHGQRIEPFIAFFCRRELAGLKRRLEAEGRQDHALIKSLSARILALPQDVSPFVVLPLAAGDGSAGRGRVHVPEDGDGVADDVEEVAEDVEEVAEDVEEVADDVEDAASPFRIEMHKYAVPLDPIPEGPNDWLDGDQSIGRTAPEQAPLKSTRVLLAKARSTSVRGVELVRVSSHPLLDNAEPIDWSEPVSLSHVPPISSPEVALESTPGGAGSVAPPVEDRSLRRSPRSDESCAQLCEALDKGALDAALLAAKRMSLRRVLAALRQSRRLEDHAVSFAQASGAGRWHVDLAEELLRMPRIDVRTLSAVFRQLNDKALQDISAHADLNNRSAIKLLRSDARFGRWIRFEKTETLIRRLLEAGECETAMMAAEVFYRGLPEQFYAILSGGVSARALDAIGIDVSDKSTAVQLLRIILGGATSVDEAEVEKDLRLSAAIKRHRRKCSLRCSLGIPK